MNLFAKKRRVSKPKMIILSVVSVLLLFLVLAWISRDVQLEEPKVAKKEETKKVATKSENVTVDISAVGDLLVHSPQLEAQFNKETQAYDFNNNFQYIKPYAEKSDLAMGCFETTLPGAAVGYEGYPTFKSPDSVATAFKGAGFDVVFTSTNHILDAGTDGFFSTITTLKNNGLTVAGTNEDTQKPYVITEVKGVKVGLVSYVYETPKRGAQRTLNAEPIPQELEDNINSFDPDQLEVDMPKIKANMEAAKKDGAEILIVYMHWGEEYATTPVDYQKQMANEIANSGADVIFASHPHVIEPVEMITTVDGTKTVPVFYALGNFISNQRSETVGNRKTEDSIMGMVQFQVKQTVKEKKGEKTIKNEDLTLTKVEALPLWVNKYYGDKLTYEIVPLDGTEMQNPGIVASGNGPKTLKSLEDTKNIVGPTFYSDPEKRFIFYRK